MIMSMSESKALLSLSAVCLALVALPGKPANAVISNPSPDCSAAITCTITFNSTGDFYSWSVPSGVSSITFDVRGGAGGSSSSGSAGGTGGKVVGTLNVAGISTLHIYVGGAGTTPTSASDTSASGGFNGGGTGGYDTSSQIQNGGGGGGASDIRTAISDLNSRLVVAGGGGGGGNAQTGGRGGGTTGQNGASSSGVAVAGGGGTPTAGGTALTTRGATTGSFAVGGQGGVASAWGGGGGGGGYYGGGGGSSGADHGSGWTAGGGGGSSYTDAVRATSVTHTQGGTSGNGLVIITYLNAPPIISIGFSGTPRKGQTVILTFTTDQPGRVTFFADQKRIAGCINLQASIGNTSCNWKPVAQRAVQVYAVISQTSRFTSTSSIYPAVARRTGLR